MTSRILCGDSRAMLATLPEKSVHCVVTSPPYFGLRAYGTVPVDWPAVTYSPMPGLPPMVEVPAMTCELGQENTPEAYIGHLVMVFREVKRVMADDATCWINVGDSYSGSGKGGNPDHGKQATNKGSQTVGVLYGKSGQERLDTKRANATANVPGIPAKNLIGVPWRVAFALQSDGWWLRSDIIWCLSGGAWLYARTQKGDMPVTVKDLVRLDPRTVSLWNGTKWTKVLGWGPSTDESERLELVLRSGERIGCTGGHKWPTQRGNVVARELRIGDTISSCQIPEPDGCWCPTYLTEDALWLIGLYLAEGSRNGSAMRLSLSADEERWMPRIASIAKHYGCTSTHVLADGSLTVRLYGRVIRSVIDAYIGGEVAINKHLKVAAWRLPNDALRLLVQGYLDGDGHDDTGNGRWRLGLCRNYSLERDLRTAAARLGATLTLKPGTATYQNGELPMFRGEWRWTRSGHGNQKDRGEVIEIRASRARGFWDIAVEDDPHLFALASGILTHNCKPAPMPESVQDRVTRSHEYIFLLAKAERYYYDAHAVREANSEGTVHRLKSGPVQAMSDGAKNMALRKDGGTNAYEEASGRNKRSVWTIGSGGGFADAHFATFPAEIPTIAIKAGTSERGHCPECNKRWVRITKPQIEVAHTGETNSAYAVGSTANRLAMLRQAAREQGREYTGARDTVGWKAQCACGLSPVPDVVLDCFSGVATTGLAAERLQRDYIGIELSEVYASMSRARIVGDAPLFTELVA